MDLRAHAHNERHRINSELQAVAAQVSAGVEPDEVHEPGRAWVPDHRRDTERGGRTGASRQPRHWKLKMWKRRSNVRRARAAASRLAAEEA
jgi:hypothetical protein